MKIDLPRPPRAGHRSPRRRARELAMQGIYQWLLSGELPGAIEAFLRDDHAFGKADQALFERVFYGALRNVDDLRAVLTPLLDRPIAELSPVEHAILVLAAFELRDQVDVPYRVVINEAVELAKSFGGSDGFKYVNGVLDKLAAILRAAEVNAAS